MTEIAAAIDMRGGGEPEEGGTALHGALPFLWLDPRERDEKNVENGSDETRNQILTQYMNDATRKHRKRKYRTLAP